MANSHSDPKRVPSEIESERDRYIRDFWRKMRVFTTRLTDGKSVDFVGCWNSKKRECHLQCFSGITSRQKWLSLARGNPSAAENRVSASGFIAFPPTCRCIHGRRRFADAQIAPHAVRYLTTTRSIRLWTKKESATGGCSRGYRNFYNAAANPAKVLFGTRRDLKPSTWNC